MEVNGQKISFDGAFIPHPLYDRSLKWGAGQPLVDVAFSPPVGPLPDGVKPVKLGNTSNAALLGNHHYQMAGHGLLGVMTPKGTKLAPPTNQAGPLRSGIGTAFSR